MNILVTGGASGVGEAITRRLALSGAHEVWFTYHSSGVRAEALERACRTAHAIHCDFRNPADISSLLQKIDEADLEALVNNAISTPITKTHFYKTDLDVFRQGFEYNVLPTIEITQRAISRFREKKGGRIVTVLTATLLGRPPTGYSEYTAAKAYLHSLAKSWASENGAFSIASNCISPSFMATQLTSDTDERIVEGLVHQHPLKRLLTPGEVAEAVEFLVNAPLQINGINLVMNAGAEML